VFDAVWLVGVRQIARHVASCCEIVTFDAVCLQLVSSAVVIIIIIITHII